MSLTGRMDAANTQPFQEFVKEKILDGERRILIDLARLDYMTSAGLRAFTLLQAIMSSYKGAIYICSPNSRIQELFGIVQIEQVYKVYDSQKKALKALLKNPPEEKGTTQEKDEPEINWDDLLGGSL